MTTRTMQELTHHTSTALLHAASALNDARGRYAPGTLEESRITAVEALSRARERLTEALMWTARAEHALENLPEDEKR